MPKKYVLDKEVAKYEAKSRHGKLKWISPSDFLKKVPAQSFDNLCMSADESGEEHFSKLGREEYKKAYVTGKPLPPLMLDFTQKNRSCPNLVGGHDGRHRAFVAKQMGIKKIPVIIIKK